LSHHLLGSEKAPGVSMARPAAGLLAAAGGTTLLAACILLAGYDSPSALLGDAGEVEYAGPETGYMAYDTPFEGPPGRWVSPDPWINDADDFAQKYGREDGMLDESFSNPQRLFAAGDGSSYEWPYVWEGKDAAGDTSGYDWEGAATKASVRRLRMPPSHDVFGELGPFPEEMNLRPGREHDEVVRKASLPGGALFSQTRSDVPMRQASRRVITPARTGKSPALAQARDATGVQQSLRTASSRQAAVRTSALANVYTDYTMSGAGVKCTCDSAAAGDEEMEGMDRNVRPACVCSGGRQTAVTGTEEGGPLDTGAAGAWPQNLEPKDGWGPQGPYVSYIDGLSSPAYKGRVQMLAVLPRPATHAALRAELRARKGGATWQALKALAARGLHAGLRARGAALRGRSRGTAFAGVKEAHKLASPAAVVPDQAADMPTWGDDEAAEEEDKGEPEAVTAGNAAKATGWDLDPLLHSKLTHSFVTFLKEAERCDAQGSNCDGRLCQCKRRAGRHLCYKLELHWPECAQSRAGLCDADAVQSAREICASVEKLPGVNVDSMPIFEVEEDPPEVTGTSFFKAPDGVHW
jgi:hypothetical protein